MVEFTLNNTTLEFEIENNQLSLNIVSNPAVLISATRQGPQGPAGPGVAPGGTAGQILAKVDSTDFNTHWINPPSAGGVTSFNSRIGAVVPQAGDYTTSIVAEGSNLYFTDARAIAATASSYAPLSRTLTINGVALDLSANRSWTVGTIGGSIAANQIAVGSGTNAISGSADLTFDGTTFQAATGKIIKGQYSNLAHSAYINPDGSAVFGNGSLIINNAGIITVSGFKLTTSPTNGYVLTSDGAGNGTWQAPTGGGGTPGGTSGAIQVNSAGAFFGDAANFVYDITQKFVGIQINTPLAPLHAVGAIGQTVPAPATLTATLALDVAINSPVTGSAMIIYSPPEATAPSINFSYIDNVFDGGSFSQSENSGTGSGWVCNGQTISGNIYAFQGTADGTGIIVLNPNGLAFSVTDDVNDGTTLFQVDLADWATSFGNFAGFFLIYSDGSTSYNQNIGNVGSITLDSTNFSDPSVFSAYPSDGSTRGGSTLAYNIINGSQYSSDLQLGSNTDANNASNYLIINASFTPAFSVPADGLYYQDNGGSYHDMGSIGSLFDDYGQGGGTGAPASFSSIAFPNFNTSLADPSWDSAQIDYGSGDLTADNDQWNLYAWEYRYYPGTSVRFFGNPVYQGGLTDDGSENSMSLSGDVIPGDGDGRVIELRDGAGTSIGYQDISSGTSFSGLDASAGAFTPGSAISGFSGVTRNWSAYGDVTSPSTKYSSTHKDYSGADNNSSPYIYQHDLATFGNATGLKIIETATANSQTIRGPGAFYDSITANTIYEFNSGLGDATVTPSTTGYLANGSNLNATYAAFATKIINATAIWSPTSPTVATVDPNDGLFYNINLVIGTVSGATYKLKRINGAGTLYQVSSSASFQDNTTIAWNSTGTLTPTSAAVSAAIFERNVLSDTDLPIMILRSSNAGTVANTGLQFEYGGGTKCGGILISGSGLMRFTSNAGGYEFYNASNALYARLGSTQFLLNSPSTSYEIIINSNASGNPLIYGSAGSGIRFIGINHNSTSPISGVIFSIDDRNTSNATNLLLSGTSGGLYIRATGKIIGKEFTVDNVGRIVTGSASTATGAQLSVFGQGSANAALLLDAGTLRGSPLANTIENDGSNLFYTNNAGSRSKNTIYAASSSATQNVIQKPDANGRLIDSAVSETGSLFIINIQTEFKQSFTLDSGRYAGLGQTTSAGSAGQLWYNATQGAIFGAVTGSLPIAFVGTVFTQTATGTVANSTAETSIDSTGNGTKTLPANSITVGKTIRITGKGIYSTTLAPTLRIKIKLGSTIILDTTAVTVVAGSNTGFTIEGIITCRTIGGSGTVFAQGIFEALAATFSDYPMVNTTTVTLATNASQALTVTAQWGTGSASNTISLTNLAIEVLN